MLCKFYLYGKLMFVCFDFQIGCDFFGQDLRIDFWKVFGIY